MTGKQLDPQHLVTARWRESFLIAWRELPPRVVLPPTGRSTLRETLLDSALCLSAIAQPDGTLVGPHADPYTERQLSIALAVGRTTTRAILHWFEDAGWLSRRSAANKRDADERELVIPVSAIVAPPGWPLVVGSRSSSDVDPRDAAFVGSRSNTGVNPRDDASSAPVVGRSSTGRGSIQGTSWVDPMPVVGRRSSSSVNPLPWNPGTLIPGRIENSVLSLGEQVAERALNGSVNPTTDAGRAERIEEILDVAVRSCSYLTPKAKVRWRGFTTTIVVELVARTEISESLVRRRAREFFLQQVWVDLGDSSQASHLREHMLKSVKVKRSA
jgi:hypothetical protein